MVDATLLEKYDTNIADAAREVSAKIDALDKELMLGALEHRFAGKQRLREILQEATAYFSFFSHLCQRWEAILDNQEAEAYMAVKARMGAGGEKFVSAAAEREAAAQVTELRYAVGYYRGELARCQEYINTCKRLLETIEQEERTT
jgi:hypothetical protein